MSFCLSVCLSVWQLKRVVAGHWPTSRAVLAVVPAQPWARTGSCVPGQRLLYIPSRLYLRSATRHHLTVPAQHFRSSGLLCCWSDGLELATGQSLRPGAQQQQLQTIAEDEFISALPLSTDSAVEMLRDSALYKFIIDTDTERLECFWSSQPVSGILMAVSLIRSPFRPHWLVKNPKNAIQCIIVIVKTKAGQASGLKDHAAF